MKEEILLVGTGRMGIEYARVLKDLKVPFISVGRGEETALVFKDKTGIMPITGGVENFIEDKINLPAKAIVAVNVADLHKVCMMLLIKGVKKILLEKPGALTVADIEELNNTSKKLNAEIFIAYNRRFLETVRIAAKMLESDGGVLSFQFEFTEWSDKVEVFDADIREKERWFLSNSSHVADLAFFIGGKPDKMDSLTAGSLSWHRSASVFCGSGTTVNGSLFSYTANWDAPGRWGIEVLSRNYRIILRPIELLQVQKRGSVTIEEIKIDDNLDKSYKPGVYRMVERFIDAKCKDLCRIDEQLDFFRFYNQIANYS